MKIIVFLIMLVAIVNCFPAKNVCAQSADLTLQTGVAPHKGVDEIYRQFSESYRTLNVEQVINLYTESAAYLVPGEEILLGRDKVRANFSPFFESVKKNGQTMTISFQIFQRKIEKNMGYDVGIYTLRTFKDGKEIGSGKGKFVVVAVKDSDGKWRFQLDAYNNLPRPQN